MQQCCQTWLTRTPLRKSPDEVFQDQHQQAKADFDAACERYQCQGTRHDLGQVEECVRRLKVLQQTDEASKEAKEHDYQVGELNQQLSLFNDLFDIFGDVAAVNAIVNNWSKRVGKQRSSHSSDTENHSQPNAFPVNDSTRTPESLRSDSHSPTVEPISTSHRTNSPGERSTNDHDQSTDVEANDGRTRSTKRKDTPASSASQSVKRPRQGLLEAATTDKIEYREVYQDGQAEDKYTIVEHDGYHYILRCKTHGLIFAGEHPLQGAMNHLRGSGHLNDTHIKRMEDQRRRRCRASQVYRVLKRDPQHGEMYMAWWDLGKTAKASGEENLKLFAFLVLPFFPEESDRFGVSVTSSNLNNDIPTCYKYNTSTGVYDWSEDYMSGGKKALERLYPIMCFDGSRVPSVQWIPITHFRRFNAKDRDLEHKIIVNDYIASQKRIVHRPGKSSSLKTFFIY
ncbi:hypothetical protein QX201_010340 [Fusarium graminearum]